MEEYSRGGRLGWYNNGNDVMSFQLGEGNPMAIDERFDSVDMNQSMGRYPMLLTLDGSHILPKGSNNMLPDEIKIMFGSNRKAGSRLAK